MGAGWLIAGVILTAVAAFVARRVRRSFITRSAGTTFTVGDTVVLDDHVGVVTEVDAKTVMLCGLDGSAIRIPRLVALDSALVNLTSESARRSELTVGVADAADLDEAAGALGAAFDRVPHIREHPKPQVLLRECGPVSTDFTMLYWHTSDAGSEPTTTHDLMRAVHHALSDAGITIAFPRLVVWPGATPG